MLEKREIDYKKAEIDGEKMSHSEEFLDDTRYNWYNRDFLDLMAKRWNLKDVAVLADIGCGLGHWHRLLVDYLKKPTKIIGIDFEQEWINKLDKNRHYYKTNGVELVLKTENAESISLPDNYCDLVTCQTLLIHVPSIEAVLKEFHRVAKPGGKIVLAEPNNLVNSVMIDTIQADKTIEYHANKNLFELGYAIGKFKNSEGKSFAVESIPNLLHFAGFKNIQVYLSDKVFNGYTSKFENDFQFVEDSDYEKSKEYLKSAGMERSVHTTYWSNLRNYYDEKEKFANKSGFFECSGSMMYLMSAEKI